MIDFDHKKFLAYGVKVALSVVRARRDRLAELLQQHRYLPVNELCEKLNVSEATARRDLAVLQKEKKLLRTYGGALLEYGRSFASFSQRRSQAAGAKRRIARKALSLVRGGSTIFLDVGTTIYFLAEELKNHPVKSLTVVTNSLPVADLLAGAEQIETHVLGGQLLARQSALLGDGKKSALPFWKFDLAFMSAEGMSPEGIWNSQDDIVSFQQSVLKRTRQAAFCLDASKIGRTTPSLLLRWKRVEKLVTEGSPGKFAAGGILLEDRQLLQA